MTEHSPLPWSSTPWENTDHHEIAIHAADGTWVADCVVDQDNDRPDEIEANAAFIIKAVNNHDVLVAALKRSKEALDVAQAALDDPRDGNMMLEAYRHARDVLKTL